ncbi:MarR family winged helix-turn-helix transcriptional regulator [Clostridium sp. WILCCON 0269]|uniref:MarR family winged helix-turn-helix transcriptional regulator n=1 Tax=Candidatus Clostridium eludens TaxID=3381663 RepID=A0ABW8SFV4_9CLOT
MYREEEYKIITDFTVIVNLMKKRLLSTRRENISNLGISSLIILNQVEKHMPKTLKEITEKSGLPNSTASVIIDKLCQRGFVHRKRDKEDRRKILIYLTEEGQRLLDDLNNKKLAYCIQVLESANDEEIEIISNGLRVLKKIMEKHVV